MEIQRRPPYLKQGDKIAIVSPAGAIDSKYIAGAQSLFRSWQLQPVIGAFAKGLYGRFSGTDEQRLFDLQQALDDPSIRAVFCSRGGYGAIRLLEKLSFEKFRSNPKWLIGFSDITLLHSAIFHCGVQSIHSIMARALTDDDPNTDPVQVLKELLLGKEPDNYILSPNILNRFGSSEGILIGGNLSVLYSLRGTRFDIQPEGKILFIEDLSEKPYHIDRMMQNLKLGGILSRLSGLLVGRFSDIEQDSSFGKTVEEIIASAVDEYTYPVAFDFPVGHVAYNMPVIHGAQITMQVSECGGNIIYNV